MEFILATNNTVLPMKLECREDSPNCYRDILLCWVVVTGLQGSQLEHECNGKI